MKDHNQTSFAQALWLANGFPAEYLSGLKLSERPDPTVDSSFKLGTAAQVAFNLETL